MLIVIAIIVLLTAMILPSIRDILEQTRVTTAKGDCRTMKAALESYGIYNRGFYPMSDHDVLGSQFMGTEGLPNEHPRIVNRCPEDPFGLTDGFGLRYETDEDYHTGSGSMQRAYYWVIWSVGPRGSCRALFQNGNGELIVNDSNSAQGTGAGALAAVSPGVPTVDQIAYDTNASLIYVYALNESAVIGAETP